MSARILQFPGPGTPPDPKPAVVNHTRRDELVLAHMHLVREIAGGIARSVPASFEMDDLMGTGYLGLIDAAERFDESKGVPFPGYARQRIRGEILDSLRRRNWRDSTHDSLDDHSFHLQDTSLMDADVPLDRQKEAERVNSALAKLNERDQKVLRMHYREEQNLEIVGAELKIHASRASQLHRRALVRLRVALAA